MKTKSYVAVPNEVLELFKIRKISAYDVKIYTYLCSMRMFNTYGENDVSVSLAKIAERCNVTSKTVSASVAQLYNVGLIFHIEIAEKPHSLKKYCTSIYTLKPLPESGFFLLPRLIFQFSLQPKLFLFYCGFCASLSIKFMKCWNSYNDIAKRLGYNPKNSHSEILRNIAELVDIGLIQKKVRKFKNQFVDNIYRITDFQKQVINKLWTWNYKIKRAEIYQPNKYKRTLTFIHRNIAFFSVSMRYFQYTLDCCINC